jgi:Flp pilus assembly protein TadG
MPSDSRTYAWRDARRPPGCSRPQSVGRHVASAFCPLAGLAGSAGGGVAIYVSLVGAIVMGSLVLGIDVGRIAVLKTQMQNAADAAAVAAAAQLDHQDGARARASQVATSAAANSSGLSLGGGDFSVASVTFFADYETKTGATSDADATFVQVTLAAEDIEILFRPVLDILSGGSSESVTSVTASAVGTTAPLVCKAPPFMICDFTEVNATDDVLDPANAGRQMILKEGGGGGLQAGNFGLLCVNDDCGAKAINEALVSTEPSGCSSTLVETATGSKTNQIRDGINARFDKGSASPKNPARNVINYPRDSDLTEVKILGNGSWGPATYWSAKHAGVAAPADVAGYTRYQMYLYELGETFARNGKRTIFPVPEGGPPLGFTLVEPPGPAIPVATNAKDKDNNNLDGVPQSTPVEDPARRVVVAAILRCKAQNVRGHGEFDTQGRYVRLFITETVSDPPKADVYAEVVEPFNQSTSADFHINARLVE